MCVSAGMLSGDMFDLELKIGEHSNLLYTSQSYEKVFASKGEKTIKRTRIRVEKEARLLYMPKPVIPFAHSDFMGENEIHLDPSSSFLYCDIFNCGRVAMGERFQMKRYQSKTMIYVGDILAMADHTLLDPSWFAYDTLGLWNNYTHNGLLYLYTPDGEQKSRIIWRQAVVNVVRESSCECWEKAAMQYMIILRTSPGRCDLFHRKSMAAGGLGSARTERHTEHLPRWCQCGEKRLFSHQRENRQWKVPQRC